MNNELQVLQEKNRQLIKENIVIRKELEDLKERIGLNYYQELELQFNMLLRYDFKKLYEELRPVEK